MTQQDESNDFDPERDKMIIVFDGDIFEEKVEGYDELISSIEVTDIAAVSNPCFELFLILHIEDSYKNLIMGNEDLFFQKDENHRFSYAYRLFKQLTGMNSKTNKKIGDLAQNIHTAIEQERLINQDVHQLKGKVSCNIGRIIENIINEEPSITL